MKLWFTEMILRYDYYLIKVTELRSLGIVYLEIFKSSKIKDISPFDPLFHTNNGVRLGVDSLKSILGKKLDPDKTEQKVF